MIQIAWPFKFREVCLLTQTVLCIAQALFDTLNATLQAGCGEGIATFAPCRTKWTWEVSPLGVCRLSSPWLPFIPNVKESTVVPWKNLHLHLHLATVRQEHYCIVFAADSTIRQCRGNVCHSAVGGARTPERVMDDD